MKRNIFTVLILLAYPIAALAQESVIMSAIEDELSRNMESLTLDGKKGPYYLSYQVKDSYQLDITADSGAVIRAPESRSRALSVDLRVGDYSLDNSNFLSLGGSSQLSRLSTIVPIDDNYNVLRRQIWQITDRAYKNALDTIETKKASIQNTVRTETVPDFTKGKATTSMGDEESFSIRKEKWIQLVEQLASLFLQQPQLRKSNVNANIRIANSYYINSEGSSERSSIGQSWGGESFS